MSTRSFPTAHSPGAHQQSAVKTGNAFGQAQNSDAQIGAVQHTGSGVSGSGEELALTLEKVVSQLDIISRTLHVLEQRVTMNESSVNVCLQYFRDAREKAQYMPQYGARMMAQIEHPESYRSDLNKLNDMTESIKSGVAQVQQEIVRQASGSHHSNQARDAVQPVLRDDMEEDDRGQDAAFDHDVADLTRE